MSACQRFDLPDLVFGQQAGTHRIDANALGYSLCRGLVVAREHDNLLHTQGMQLSDHGLGVRADSIFKGNQTQYARFFAHYYDRAAFGFQCRHDCLQPRHGIVVTRRNRFGGKTQGA